MINGARNRKTFARPNVTDGTRSEGVKVGVNVEGVEAKEGDDGDADVEDVRQARYTSPNEMVAFMTARGYDIYHHQC